MLFLVVFCVLLTIIIIWLLIWYYNREMKRISEELRLIQEGHLTVCEMKRRLYARRPW